MWTEVNVNDASSDTVIPKVIEIQVFRDVVLFQLVNTYHSSWTLDNGNGKYLQNIRNDVLFTLWTN